MAGTNPDALFAEIESFLCRSKPPSQASEAGLQGTFAYWNTGTSLTAPEITMLRTLNVEPGCARSLAHRLGRDPESIEQFLDGLIAVGVLERHGETYTTTAAARIYCQALQYHWGA